MYSYRYTTKTIYLQPIELAAQRVAQNLGVTSVAFFEFNSTALFFRLFEKHDEFSLAQTG